MTISNLRDERERQGRPLSSYTVTIERYAPGESPVITVRGLGDDAADFDVQAFSRDMHHASLVIGEIAHRSGNQVIPIAYASFWTDGHVNTLADVELFSSAERQTWLFERMVPLVPESFRGLFERQGMTPPPES